MSIKEKLAAMNDAAMADTMPAIDKMVERLGQSLCRRFNSDAMVMVCDKWRLLIKRKDEPIDFEAMRLEFEKADGKMHGYEGRPERMNYDYRYKSESLQSRWVGWQMAMTNIEAKKL